MEIREVYDTLVESGKTDAEANTIINQAEATLPGGQAHTGDQLWAAVVDQHPELAESEDVDG